MSVQWNGETGDGAAVLLRCLPSQLVCAFLLFVHLLVWNKGEEVSCHHELNHQCTLHSGRAFAYQNGESRQTSTSQEAQKEGDTGIA